MGHILKACLGQSKISAVLYASVMLFYSNAALRGSHGLSALRTKSSRLEARSVISNTKIDATSLNFEFTWVSLPSSEAALCALCVGQRIRG